MWLIVITDEVNDEKSIEVIVVKTRKDVKKRLKKIKKDFRGFHMYGDSSTLCIDLEEDGEVTVEVFEIDYNSSIYIY